jgi:hypothetical protein
MLERVFLTQTGQSPTVPGASIDGWKPTFAR